MRSRLEEWMTVTSRHGIGESNLRSACCAINVCVRGYRSVRVVFVVLIVNENTESIPSFM